MFQKTFYSDLNDIMQIGSWAAEAAHLAGQVSACITSIATEPKTRPVLEEHVTPKHQQLFRKPPEECHHFCSKRSPEKRRERTVESLNYSNDAFGLPFLLITP